MEKINYKIEPTKRKIESNLYTTACYVFLGLFSYYCYSLLYQSDRIDTESHVEDPAVYEDHTVPIVYSMEDLVVPELLSDDNIICLMQNAYFEARNQSDEAIMAVVMVVLNRTKNLNYPSSICDVVHQGYTDKDGNVLKGKCQFAWYCDGKSDRMYDGYSSLRVKALVYKSLLLWYNGVDITKGSTHYHANWSRPEWRNGLKYVIDIGDHKFYKT